MANVTTIQALNRELVPNHHGHADVVTQINEGSRVVAVRVLGQLGVVLRGLEVPLEKVQEAEIGRGRRGHLRLLLLEGLQGVGGVGKVLKLRG